MSKGLVKQELISILSLKQLEMIAGGGTDHDRPPRDPTLPEEEGTASGAGIVQFFGRSSE